MSNTRNTELTYFTDMFKALANPHRLQIFVQLANCCDAPCCTEGDLAKTCVGELGRDLGITASTLSHHLKELHHNGLIRMQRRGQNVDCWVDPDIIERLGGFFTGLGRDTTERK